MKHLLSLSFLAVFSFELVKSSSWFEHSEGYGPDRWDSSWDIDEDQRKYSRINDEEQLEQELHNLVERKKRSPRGKPRPAKSEGSRSLARRIERMQKGIGNLNLEEFIAANEFDEAEANDIQALVQALKEMTPEQLKEAGPGQMKEKFQALEPETRKLLSAALRPTKGKGSRGSRRELTLDGAKLDMVDWDGLSEVLSGTDESKLNELIAALKEMEFGEMTSDQIKDFLRQVELNRGERKQLMKFAVRSVAAMGTEKDPQPEEAPVG